MGDTKKFPIIYFSYRKRDMSRSDKKDIIVWLAAIIAFLTGIGLCIAGFVVPPTGVISGSVLTVLGELLTFFGSVFGIGKFTEIKIKEIEYSNKQPKNNEQDDEK